MTLGVLPLRGSVDGSDMLNTELAFLCPGFLLGLINEETVLLLVILVILEVSFIKLIL